MDMSGFLERIEGELYKGNAVVIQGRSGSGKTEILRALRERLDGINILLDMRYVNGRYGFYEKIRREICSQTKSCNSLACMDEVIKKGRVNLLLDEYWAGKSFCDDFLEYAHRYGNKIVTVAGVPRVDSYVEFIIDSVNP
ncbi:MAG TPA: hypothetical protein ENG00_01345 [Candidatus Aenigmarchaeota archaeon]|nr:hypothetical protein [Candidatus Aenigmarchaeota archaeon]